MLTVVVSTVSPDVTAAAVINPSQEQVGGEVIAGTAPAASTIRVYENNKLISSLIVAGSGKWTFAGDGLDAGSHHLDVVDTDVVGTQSTSVSVVLKVPQPRYDVRTGSASSVPIIGSDYHGPVSYIKSEVGYAGSEGLVVGSRTNDVYIHTGSGNDAIAVSGGSNVLDGGSGSNWLVGASGLDGGTDTFFTDLRFSGVAWDTVLNFHIGDVLTLWGYDPVHNKTSWQELAGAVGYQGATVQTLNSMGQVQDSVTFAGLNRDHVQFASSSGTISGLNYLVISRST